MKKIIYLGHLKHFYKWFFLIAFFFMKNVSLFASGNDTISTRYENGEFVTLCQLRVHVSPEIMSGVMDDYVYQLKYDLDKLYTWALKGLKLRKESDDLIVFNFKSTEFDEKEDIVKAVGEVIVPGIITFPEIHVDSRVTNVLRTDGKDLLYINMLYSDAFLKKTTGIFQMTPINENECIISLMTNIKFGWFFNVFITHSSFRKIMEWRFHKMMLNVSDEAIRRSKAPKTYNKRALLKTQKSRLATEVKAEFAEVNVHCTEGT